MPRTKPRPTSASAIRLDFTPMRRRRRQVEMSQGALAAAIGVHRQTIYRTERNRSEPTLRQMYAIARALGTPIHLLVHVLDADAPDVGA
jgi:DNA-binding XRE family transcriptional regulator